MAADNLAFTPAWQLKERILRKDLSPVEVTDYFLRRIERLNPQLNAYLTVCADQAMDQAREAEKALARGEKVGPLHGLPLSIKDLTPTRDIRTTYGSLVYKDWVPDRDDVVVERVRAAGAIILGKTNSPEFGSVATTENLVAGPCCNPWDQTRIAGGSSGGAASAVAAGLGPLAVGSDGGGSIRIPATFCGIFGLLPSQGRVPEWGIDPPVKGEYRGRRGRFFGQNGPMTRDVRDAIMLLQVMAGPDPRDPTCLHEPPPDFSQALDGDVRGLRIAWSPDFGYAPVDPEVQASAEAAARAFSELGARVEQADPPIGDPAAMREMFRTIMWSNWHAFNSSLLEAHADKLTPFVRQMLEGAREWKTERLVKALHELEAFRYRMARFFDSFDLLLSPTSAVPAWTLGQIAPSTIGGKVVDPWIGFNPFCLAINMAWQTAANVPCGFNSQGLPIGLHIVGPRWAEVKVLRASVAFERARPWAQHQPPSPER
ncbi:MAG: amidase [Chloroflexi bacterium]|nr:amidase [Chloroflexota bacterium]